jgi:hypothetical protein
LISGTAARTASPTSSRSCSAVSCCFSPGPGALALVWLIAAHAIAIGILLLAAGLSLRRHGERPFEGSPRHA